MIVHSSKNPIILSEIGLNRDFLGLNGYKYRSLQNNKNTIVKKPKLTSEEIAEMNKIGDQIQKYVIKNLNKYASSKEFLKNHKNDTITDLSIDIDEEDQGVSSFGVKVSDFQDGIDEEYLDKWRKKNPDKDLEDCPIFNNDWYYDLLNKGKELAKEANKLYNPDNKYYLAVGTGDGDEAIIFIDLEKK